MPYLNIREGSLAFRGCKKKNHQKKRGRNGNKDQQCNPPEGNGHDSRDEKTNERMTTMSL
jgi:hypothetical protein